MKLHYSLHTETTDRAPSGHCLRAFEINGAEDSNAYISATPSLAIRQKLTCSADSPDP